MTPTHTRGPEARMSQECDTSSAGGVYPCGRCDRCDHAHGETGERWLGGGPSASTAHAAAHWTPAAGGTAQWQPGRGSQRVSYILSFGSGAEEGFLVLGDFLHELGFFFGPGVGSCHCWRLVLRR